MGFTRSVGALSIGLLTMLACASCSDDAGSGTAYVRLQNDFQDPAKWAICKSSYLGQEFGAVARGETSAEQEVEPGLDYVLMVAAWDDPTCAPEHCLPLASKNEEEIVDGQHRTITLALANHQGPCPPEGVPPIPQAQYDRVLALWPDFGFEPYAQRTDNPQCVK